MFAPTEKARLPYPAISVGSTPAASTSLASGHNLVGVEWCTSLDLEIQQKISNVGCLEIIPENFFEDLTRYPTAPLFPLIREFQIPVILHSIGLSLSSLEPIKQAYFDKIRRIADQIPTIIQISDHLCTTEMDGSAIGQLTNTFYNDDTLDCITKKIEQIQKQITVPFALENITHAFHIPCQKYSETEFFGKLCNRTGVGMLLDLNNIYTNGYNFATDPVGYLSELDFAHVAAIHLAGGYFDGDGFLQDGHCADVPDSVWQLYEKAIQKARRPILTIVEKTGRNEVTGLTGILQDRQRALKIMKKLVGLAPTQGEALL